VGVGIAEALIMVLSTTMIGDTFQGRARDKRLAAQTAFASLSALLFFNIGGQLGSFWLAHAVLGLSSALLMLALVLVYTREPKSDVPHGQAAKIHAHASSAAGAGFPGPACC
jgi:MFS family permease